MAGKSDVVVRFLGDTTGLDKAVNKSHSSLSKFGNSVSAIGNKIGGDFGEALSLIGESIDRVGEKGVGFGAKLAVAGGAVTGLGVALQQLGSANKQADDQLRASIEATGNSFDDFEASINKTVSAMADFGHSDDDTKNALQKLTQATNDPTKALQQMGLVADLAAAQHVSLADAAGLVAKIMGGSGGRTLAQYGITMTKAKDGTKDVNGALDQLAGKLKGQASAATDNFGAKVGAIRTKLGDWAADMANKVGPAITALGPVMMGVGAIIQSGMIPKIRAAVTEFKNLSLESLKTSKGLKAAAVATLALAAAGAAVKSFGDASVNAGAGTNALTNSLEKMANTGAPDATLGFTNMGGEANSFNDALKTVSDNSIWDQMDSWGAQFTGMSGNMDLAKQSVSQVDAALAGMVSNGNADQATRAFKVMADQFAKQGGDVSKLNSLFPQYTDALAGAAAGTDDLASSTKAADASAKDTRTSIQKLSDAIDKLRGKSISADQATSDLEQAIDDATQAAKDNAKALHEHNGQLDLSTPKARAARDALANIATTALDGVPAWRAHGMAARDVAQKTLEARNAFIEAARKMGLGKTAAENLATAYGLIPKKVQTDVAANTGQAKNALQNLAAQIANLAKHVQIDVRAGTQGTGGGRRTVPAMADGGIVTGPTLALIGEAGPEAVMPLSKLGGHGSGGGVHLHFNGPVIGGTATEIARQLAQILERGKGNGLTYNF